MWLLLFGTGHVSGSFSCAFCVFFAASTGNAKLGIGVSLLGSIVSSRRRNHHSYCVARCDDRCCTLVV